MVARTFYCSTCKRSFPIQPNGGTGYAVKRNGHKVCYACCAIRDSLEMCKSGHSKRLPLYLSKDKEGRYTVSNWPGTLSFRVWCSKEGKHNIAGTRTDVWFAGPDGHEWHGVQYGEFTQIVHCRRTKELI